MDKDRIDRIARSVESRDLTARPSATSEYKRQSGEVEKNLKSINASWAKMKKYYEAQQKDNPDSWSGIGRGSELGDMVVETSELAEMMESFSRVFH